VTKPLAPGPLAGLRVVDLTLMLSGPFGTGFLADLGADVVKVEPLTGDPTRGNAFAPGDTLRAYGGYFQSINRGKRSVAVDLKSERGREVLRRLAAGADVLVENYKAGVMERLGLGYEELHALNPRLVYACIRGFGDPRTGESPYAQWPAFDVVAQAMSGFMSMTGPGPGQPMKSGASVGDLIPGMAMSLGVLAAVHHAQRTGEGQFVDVGMYDVLFAFCEQIVYRYSYMGEVTEPSGNGHPFLCPFDAFPASDGWVTIAAPLDHLWQQLCQIMGREDLLADPELVRPQDRSKHAPRVRTAITAWTSQRTRGEIGALLGGKVPFGSVQDVTDVFADPHAAAREMIVEVEQPGLDRPVYVTGSPIKMTVTPTGPRGRAPLLSEHADAILGEAGYAPDEIAALRESGAIR
jgi:crotonobetainyl-CoA:carnitine CoA-transferase CaiB-like acyl-CoA transferase